MGQIAQFPTLPPAPAVMQILSRFNREQLHGFIAVALDLADAMDGDPDLETCAVEDDGTPMPKEIDFGPGCGIADTDAAAWVEWHTKPANTRRRGQPEYTLGEEDDEDDDPAGQYDEDCITGLVSHPSGAGCPISDPDHGIDDLPQGTPGLDC